jgi:hypothetical protein
MKVTLFFLFLMFHIQAFGFKDSLSRNISLIGAQVSVDLPMADLAKRFGVFDKVGLSFHRKTKSNWIIGTRFHFIFGSKIKEPGFLNNLGTQTGGTITTDGSLAEIRLYQRGYNVGLDVGKIIPIWKKNQNSGLFWMTSLGFMQHKINIFDRDLLYPQLYGDYKKGYDRLTNGLYADAMFGIMHFGVRKNINGFVALNVNVASTQGRREWWYDVQKAGLDKRIDASIGLMAGWFIPLYQKKVEEVYY